MENASRIRRRRRKENKPPDVSNCMTPEQRNVQKNVNCNAKISDSALRGLAVTRTTFQGRFRAASFGSGADGPPPAGRIQTNLPRPYWPVKENSGLWSCRKQNNLEYKLQRQGLGNRARIGDWFEGNLLLDSKKTSPKDLTYRHHDARRSCYDVPENRVRYDVPQVLKQPLGRISVPEGNARAFEIDGDDTFSNELSDRLYSGALLDDCYPSLWAPDSHDESPPPGPALTLDNLNVSPPAERYPSSASFQALVRSSRTSGELHGSLRRLELSMGALGSSPWESKSSPRPCKAGLGTWTPTPGPLSIVERLAAEQSYAKQASVKWRASFHGDWGLGSTRRCPADYEGIPLTAAGRYIGWSASPAEPPELDFPTDFCGSFGSTSFGRGEDGLSTRSFLFKPVSRVPSAPEGKKHCNSPDVSSEQNALDLDTAPLGLSGSSSEVGHEDFSFDPLSVEDLETLPKKASGSARLASSGTPRDAAFAIRSLGGLGTFPALGLENWTDVSEAEEDGKVPFLANSAGSFLPRQKLSHFGAAARVGLQERSQAAYGMNTVDFIDSVNEAADVPANLAGGDLQPAVRGAQTPICPVPTAKPGDDLACRKERDRRLDIIQEENLERDDGSTEEKRDSRRPDPTLAKSFLAWRDHVSGKKMAAQAFYERRLMWKGLAALRWAVDLKNAAVGIAQRNHVLAIKAAGFQKWREAAAKRQAARLQEETDRGHGGPGTPGRVGSPKQPFWAKMSADQQKDAALYSRAEGGLWMQLHHTHGADELNRKMEAIRDMRRLAAFRLWCLQKEHLDQEEAEVLAARAILQRKKLANLFRRWRSVYRTHRQVWLLADRVQRGLIARCFDGWKRFAAQEVLARLALRDLRERSLRLCFHQWSRMVRVQENAKQLLGEFLAMKQRKYHEKLGLTSDLTVAQPGVKVENWSQRNGSDTFEGLLRALTLQKAFQIWKARWKETHLANRALVQRRMTEILAFWRWKALCRGFNDTDLTEDYLLASLGSEESSLSSGFHSNAPTAGPSSSGGSLEKENSLEENSHTSASSSAMGEDSAHESPVTRHSLAPPYLLDVPMESASQAASPCRPQTRAFTLRHEAVAQFQGSRLSRLLASCFGRWKTAFQKSQRHKEESSGMGPVGKSGAVRRWRKATRGYRALRFSSANQASSYWTRAAGTRFCSQQRSNHVGARKLMKPFLTWSGRQTWVRDSGSAIWPSLTFSSFRVWLMVYRCQSRTWMGRKFPESPEIARQLAVWGWTQESNQDVVSERLGRKYLSKWKRNVLLQRFRSTWDARHLAKSWLCWKDASKTELVVKTLARQRLVDWSWKTWRERCLRSWVAEGFLDASQRDLLEKAFERWRQRLAKETGENS